MALTQRKIDTAWNAAKALDDHNLARYREDPYGHMMARTNYKIDSSTGWKVDNVIPKKYGGTDNIENLQAMNYQEKEKLFNAGEPLTKKTRYGEMKPVSGNNNDISEGVIMGGKQYALRDLKILRMVKLET